MDEAQLGGDPPDDGRSWRGTGWAVVALTLIGLLARLTQLGERPLHHDESIDVHFSRLFIQGKYLGYDPVYHGPIRFYIEGGFFKLFGESVSTARLLAALAGTGLIALPWIWRRSLGRAGTLAACMFLCLSPSFLYFSRFGREDAFFALLTYGFVIAVLALIRRPAAWHPVAAVLLLVAAWALKESVLINLLILGTFLIVLAIQQLILARPSLPSGPDPDQGPVLGPDGEELLPAVEASWAGGSGGLPPPPPELAPPPYGPGEPPDPARARWVARGTLLGGMALMLGTFYRGERITTWLRQAKPTYPCSPTEAVSADSLAWGIGGVGALLVLAFAVVASLAWKRGVRPPDVPLLANAAHPGLVAWMVAIALGAFVFAGLFTTFFTNMDGEPPVLTVDQCDDDTVNDTNPTRWSGPVDGLIGGFVYWAGEQETLRGDDRWFYYLVLIPTYEALAALLALVGAARALKRMSTIDQVLLWWAVVGVAAYSYAGERMPWLVIHPLLPIVLLAGLGAQFLWERRREVFMVPVVTLGSAMVAWTAYTSFMVNYERGAEPQEMFVQAAQASSGVPAVVDRLEELNRVSWAERGRGIRVGLADDVYWLWWFYFPGGEKPEGSYVVIQEGEPAVPEGYDVLLVPDADESFVDALGTFTGTPFRHRVWWSEVTDWWGPYTKSDGTERTTGLPEWFRYLLDRETWTPTQGLNGSVYITNELLALESRAGIIPQLDSGGAPEASG